MSKGTVEENLLNLFHFLWIKWINCPDLTLTKEQNLHPWLEIKLELQWLLTTFIKEQLQLVIVSASPLQTHLSPCFSLSSFNVMEEYYGGELYLQLPNLTGNYLLVGFFLSHWSSGMREGGEDSKRKRPFRKRSLERVHSYHTILFSCVCVLYCRLETELERAKYTLYRMCSMCTCIN